MKETTGELNITLIVIIGVSILVAFFYFVIWPSLDENFQANSKCSRAVCKLPEECKKSSGNDNSCPAVIGDLVSCYYIDNKGNKHEPIYCPWKG